MPNTPYLVTPYRVITSFTLTFLVVFVAAKFGQYLFFEWNTSPAILWPAAGIILAILWIRGYAFVVPIFLALCLSSYTAPTGNAFPMFITTPLAQTLGGVVGVYLLRRLRFVDTFSGVQSVVTFLTVSVVASMVGPTITTTVSNIFGDPTVPFYFSWMRTWAGYLFSFLLLFPFIVTWSKPGVFNLKQYKPALIEMSAVACLLFVSTYIIFWRQLEGESLFLFLTIFFVSVFWACLRFPNRVVNLAMVCITVFGILGLFLVPDSESPLNNRLLATELFFLIFIPIFYTFSALVEESHEALRDLAETKDKFEHESVSKSEFIAILAHELRNPLAPLKSTLEILELEDVPPDTKALISSAKMQVHTMRRLLDDLLDTTRMMQGKFQLQITRANLCDMLQHCLDYTKSIYAERNHSVAMKKTCDENIWLDVDPMRFEQVVVNILNNAAKYMNPGGTVTVDYEVVGDEVKLIISDTGMGISKQNIEHIFDSFWQVDKIIPRAGGGIGVGLSLTKQIVEMHGGTIVAHSEGLGQGTSFVVSLPLSRLPESRSLPTVKAKPELAPTHILVADDNEAAANSLAKLLTIKGHAVDVAYSGLDTITAVQEKTPRVILLDIGLPDLDGYTVAKRVRAGGYRGQLIALSGYSQKEDIEKAKASGFDHYLTKPISIDTLETYLSTKLT